jgi:flagellar FliJ protein
VKRFLFRLERIRELRERAERERAAVLGAAMQAERAEQAALRRARLEFERAGEQAAGAAESATLHVGVLRNMELARAAAAQRVDAAAESLREASGKVDEEQDRYGEARRELRVVEKLKEKRFEAWRDENVREERKETDGVAQNRHSTREERT